MEKKLPLKTRKGTSEYRAGKAWNDLHGRGAFEHYLTESERQQREEKLGLIVEKSRKGLAMTEEETVRALEHLCALNDRETPYFEEVVRMAEKTLAVSFDPEKQKTIVVTKEANPTRVYNLRRGVVFHLTWDGRLVKIEFHRKEIALRKRALGFVGAGEDCKKDVAREHDRYITGLQT